MAMNIIIHSTKSVEETVVLTSVLVNTFRQRFEDRFWFSRVIEASKLSKEVMQEEFGFSVASEFIVRDNTKGFDDLHEIAKSIRAAIGKEFAIVTYSDTGKLFPNED